MEHVVVAFRSRAETVKFSEILKRYGVYNEIVSTPKEAGVGCGLSVKISKNSVQSVKRVVAVVGMKSFAGFFLVKTVAGSRMVKSI